MRGPTLHQLAGVLALAAAFLVAPAAGAGPRPLWSFHAGAPLSGPPGIGADGSLAVGTVDGYVHALGPDGAFRYSYTVEGRVVASPVVLDDGLVLVASDKSRLYAIKPDGSLAWWRMVAGGVASPLALDPQGRVWMRTGSGTAIAMSRRGGIVGFAKIGRAMTLGPTPLLNGGGVVVGDPAGELGLIGEYGRFRRARSEALGAFWALASGFLALGGKKLHRMGAELEVTWMRVDVDGVLCRSPIVTLEAGELRWVDGSGNVTAHVVAPKALATPSACTASSLFAVDERGIAQFRPSGETVRLEAADGGLIGLDASRPGALVLSYRDGRLVALKVAP